LKAALGSLDVQLEEELNRYRRLQGRRPQRKHEIQPDAVAVVGVGQLPSEPRQGSMPTVPKLSSHPSARHALGQPDDAVGFIPPLAIAPNADEETLTNAILSNMMAEGFADQDAADLPEDYLASSEQLLRSLAEEEAELRAEEEPGLLQTLLTPLGIGSMLLLLLSSVTFGYLFTNPDSFKILGFEKWLNSAQTEPEVSGSLSPALNSQVPNPVMSPDLSSEEFVEINLGTLSTLSPGGVSPDATPQTAPMPSTTPSIIGSQEPAIATAPSSTRPSTTVAPAPAPSAAARTRSSASQSAPSSRSSTSSSTTRTRQPAASAPPASPRPQAASRPAPANPQPAPTAPRVATAPATSNAPPRQDLYYVVTEYTGDRSLEAARQSVGDAYVRNLPNRAVVQMGAFSDRSRAEELQQQLQRDGISAQVYEP
jgi:hypothetical protein